MKNVLVIDIGGTSIRYGLVKNGKLTSIDTISSYKINVDQLLVKLKQIFEEYRTQTKTVLIASPGAIDSEGNVNYWSAINGLGPNFKFKKTLLSTLDAPDIEIMIINDANASAYGEFDALRKQKKFSQISSIGYLGIGSGIGGGVILNGDLVIGSGGFAGEFGSSFEMWDKHKKEYTSPQEIGGFYSLIRDYNKIATDKVQNGKHIFEQYDKFNEKKIVSLINYFYDSIVRSIWSIHMTYNPPVIIIGGGLMQRKQAINEIVDRTKVFFTMKGVDHKMMPKIVEAKLFDDAPLYGLYARYQDHGGENEQT